MRRGAKGPGLMAGAPLAPAAREAWRLGALNVLAGLVALLAFTSPAKTASAAEAPTDSARIEDLERKVDALTEEIEQMKLGVAADTSRQSAALQTPFGPAAAKVYGARPGVSIGGYGEMVLNVEDRQQENGAISATDTRVDLLRAVIYAGYKFDDQWLLNSELEWESGGVLDQGEATVDSSGTGHTELSGEATVEFAYLDWAPRRQIGVRAGKVLVPVGITNEMHEPPITIGALRPDPELVIIPTTWSASAVGVFGALEQGFAYRAYLMEGLDGANFTAASAIREGRQNASKALATHPAGVVRVDYSGHPGLTLGASYYAGHAWQRDQPAGKHLDPIVRLYELHGRWLAHALEVRALYANGSLSQASELSDQIGLTGAERLGDSFFGAYIEAAYDVMPRITPGSRMALLPYLRYEESDTQDGVIAPGNENPALHRTAFTVGVAVKPATGLAFKAERQQRHNETRTDTGQWNLSLGWMF